MSIGRALGTGGALCGALGVSAIVHAAPITALPDLSLLTPYAVFGNYLNLHNVTIQGDAGVSNNGTFKLESPSSVSGDVTLGTGVSASGGGYPGNIGGALTTGANLAATQQQVADAAAALLALGADTTVASVTTGTTFGAINGTPDVYVIKVTGNVSLGSGEHITFGGDAGDYFVLNILGDLDMSGDAAIGSMAIASRVLLTLSTSGSLGNVAHVDNVINATTLIPRATYAEFHSVNGAVYGGAGQIKMMSGSDVEGIPFEPGVPVPEPASIFLLGSGLVGLSYAARRFGRSSHRPRAGGR